MFWWRTIWAPTVNADQTPRSTCSISIGRSYQTSTRGTQRSFIEMLKAAHLWEFFVLMVISFNLPHGWDNNDMRRRQIMAVIQHIAKNFNAKNFVLFQECCPGMLADLQSLGIELPGEQDPDIECFEFWKSRGTFKKFDRVMMNRFMAGPTRAEKVVPWWNFDFFERQMVGLELDMFKSKRFEAKMIVKASALEPAGESGGPTGSKILHVEDKALKACCDNAVCISVAMLTGPSNRRLCDLVIIAAEGSKVWRAKMVKECRSSDGCRKFLIAQSCGAFVQNLYDTLMKLENAGHLERGGFYIPKLEDTDDNVSQFVEMDEEMADTFWSLQLASFGARGSRKLYLFISVWHEQVPRR
jgi:hypothetical protein